jgi:hypothetical protein
LLQLSVGRTLRYPAAALVFMTDSMFKNQSVKKKQNALLVIFN